MTKQTACVFPDGYPAPLEAIGTIVFENLSENGFDAPSAQARAFEIAERVRDELGGTMIYINRGTRFDKAQRDKIIFREFDGENYAALARKHRVTVMRIRHIIAKERKAQSAPAG